MKKVLTFVLVAVAVMSMSMAQNANDPVVMEVNGRPIYKSQFMKEFLQSIGKDPKAAPTACTYEKRKALEDYVQLYANFQAKLADAYAEGIDTNPQLQRELKTYRNELVTPYLIDSATLQSFFREAYERNQYVLHAAHILVPCQELALPEDTLKAYNHAMELYKQIQSGTDFFEVSRAEMRSQRLTNRDPEIRAKADQLSPTEGDLGCFTVFDMIYAFESQAYSMQPGEVSLPIRTRFGYHIIKLFDRYKYYGKAQLAHVWISSTNPEAKQRIQSAYRKLVEGEDFGRVAQNFSDDRNSRTNGGVLPEMACNQLPPDYVAAVAAGLKPGEYTQPFETSFGWHIVKLVSQEELPSFESLVPYYKSRMNRGERSRRPQHVFVEQCKQKYNFVDYTTVKTSKKKNAPYAASLEAVRSIITDSIFSAIFHYDSNGITDMRPLFAIGDKNYNSRDFARHIYDNRRVRAICDLDMFLKERYKEFVQDMVVQYADSRLEQDNDEFRALIDEYRHGLMIFAYNDKHVWSKAIIDSAGFAQFYDMAMPTHSLNDTNDSVYFWNERARVNCYYVSDSACLDPAKAAKVMAKCVKKSMNSEETKKALVKKVAKKQCNAEDPVTVNLELVEKGNQQLLARGEWKKGVYFHPNGKGYTILVVEKIMEPEAKGLMEARGYYLNDYQNYLDKELCDSLRKKYNVTIHQEVVDEITY